jgi:hypothetical protein
MLLMSLGVLASPAIAATSAHLPCDQSTAPTLYIEHNELVSTVISHSASVDSESTHTENSQNFLTPRAAAAIRDAFKNSDEVDATPSSMDVASATRPSPLVGTSSKPAASEKTDRNVDTESAMHTKLPGISDEDLVRYKKQMYRRDI